MTGKSKEPGTVSSVLDPSWSEKRGVSRKATTQERILRAAMELFAARGFERTSVAQIAMRSGLSRAAIFWHFGDKATLFRETCRRFLEPFRASLEQSVRHLRPDERLVEQIATYERFVEENRETIQAFVGWVFSSPRHAAPLRDELLALHRAFRRNIEQALIALLVDPPEASAIAAALVSLLHGNLLLALVDGPGPGASRPSTARQLLKRLLADIDRSG